MAADSNFFPSHKRNGYEQSTVFFCFSVVYEFYVQNVQLIASHFGTN